MLKLYNSQGVYREIVSWVKAEQIRLQNCALEGRLVTREVVQIDENRYGD